MIRRYTVGVCIVLVILNVFFVRLLQSFLSRLQTLTCAFPIFVVVWICGVPAWGCFFDFFDDWYADECKLISHRYASLTCSMDWVLFVGV